MKINSCEQIKLQASYDKSFSTLNHGNKIKLNIYIIIAFCFIFFLIILLIFSTNNKNQNYQNQNIGIKNKFSFKPIKHSEKEKIFYEKLKLILDNEEICENELMSKHTTFQLGGPAKFFIKPNSINKILKVIQLCREYSIEYFILGNGSNLLVSDQGYDGLVINIKENNFSDLKIKQIDETNYKINVGGGTLMRTLAQRLCLLSLSGLEDIIDIPGTIGGGIIMNASAGEKGLIYNSLEKVKVITPEGEIKELSKKECKLRHRGSFLQDNKYIVIEAIFNLIKTDKMIIQKTMADHTSRRYSKQPMYFPSAGCFFVWNKPKFGSLYEKYKESNLVSYKVGDAMIYTYNIAFIVNLGDAKSSDVYQIVTKVENIMLSKYKINIKREVVVLGSFS